MFVGRDRELGELERALRRTLTGEGSLYLLAGEPGIGKTRLASELTGSARKFGVRAAWGRCWEAGGAPAFWPWHEAFDALGSKFPDAATIAASDPAEARFALFREIASALSHVAAREPLLIVLEDLHAADLSTLLLLELVARQLQTSPIMLVGTYRDLEARLRQEPAEAIARLARAGTLLMLARLAAADVTAIVRDAIANADDRLAASVYDTTHGNPLFVDEIVRDVRARGTGDVGSIPLGVREVIRQRLGVVSEQARGVLEAGAVLGVEFGAAEIGRMISGADAVVDDATRGGLLTRNRGRYRFSHALYREALYHDMPRARRQELHRDAAHALDATGAPLAETAHHLLESGPDAATEAIDRAIAAAEHALGVFAFEDATALLDRARAAIPEGALEASLRGRVLIATGDARIRSGDPTGRALCVQAAQLARTHGDTKLFALAALAYGAVFTMGGVDPTLVSMLEEALASLPDADDALRARVMARLGAARQPSAVDVRQRDIDLAIDAIAMARRVAEPRDLLAVLHSASGALYGAAHPRVRLPNSREQEKLAEELGDVTRLLQARVRIAMDLLELGDLASYAQLAESYAEIANRLGRVAAPWRAELMRSMVAIAAERFDDSERHQEESKRLEAERPAARRAQTLHRVGFLRAAERHAELRASVTAMRGAWLEMPFGIQLVDARTAAVLAHLGAEDEVRAILENLSPEVWREQINTAGLAEAVWLTGDAGHAKLVHDAMAWIGDNDRWVVHWLDTEILEAPVGRLSAYVAGVLGEWSEADRDFARALSAVEHRGRRGLAARMRFEYGDLLVRKQREPERARELLREARAGASASGLTDLVSLIDRRHPAVADAKTPDSTRARSVARAPAFTMALEGEYYSVPGARGTLRFKASRGMQYLAHLSERPGIDVHVLELAGSSDHADRGDAGELLDAPAFRAYRARLVALREVVEQAEALGNADRAESARAEMESIASEIAKGTTMSGRARRSESAVDRARSAVQRRIKDALDRIAEQDGELGAWLRRSIRTGNYCSFRPGA